MKTDIKSTLTVTEAMQQLINSYMVQAINAGAQAGGAAGAFGNLDIAKKTMNATCTNVTFNSEIEEWTITFVTDDSVAFTYVKSANEILVIPKIDSRVTIGFDNDGDPYLITSQDPNVIGLIVRDATGGIVIRDITDNVTSTISVDMNGILMNSSTFGGLVKIVELTEKLNKLTDDFNKLVQKYNAHIHTTTATVGATTVPGVISPTTSTGSTTASFNKDDYENLDIQHGPKIEQ